MSRATLMILVLAAVAGLARAQQAPPGTPGLLSQTYWNDVPAVTDVLTHDGVGEGVNAFGRVCLEEAATLEKTGEKVLDAASKPGLSGAMRKMPGR